ncbi:MAG: PEP-CTERM-box response regulator transcription factor [Thermodesulfobacteriota bacterium]
MDKPKILVVEDDESIRTQMKWALVHEYDVYFATDAERAIELLAAESPPLVVLDLGLPPSPEDTSEGLRLLTEVLKLDPTTKIIVVSGNPDRESSLRAVSMGAHDFFTKPIDIEELKAILKRAYYVHTLEEEYRELRKRVQEASFEEIIGTSPQMQEIYSTVAKVATTDVPVLITGESGTGKELVARAIHSSSLRAARPFVPINCGAIPENLMESELFGHEKGAFTGAHMQRKGRFELAAGGTLFLDEIGELPAQLQVKLLRFLQDHRVERVGGREAMEIDVRVIAATNRDIKKLAEEGSFREDLYYRIAVVNIDLPPLRERGEDILLLARSFLKKYAGRGGPRTFTDDAVEVLTAYSWPGNVREIENRMRRAVTLAEDGAITAEDLGLGQLGAEALSLDIKKARERLDSRYITMAVLKHNGNISKAAEELGLSRPTLHNLIRKYNIKTDKGAD